LRALLSITFPQGFGKSKKFGHWTLGSGKKRPLNGVRKTDIKKILLTKAKFAAILHSFTLKDSESLKMLDIRFQEVGAKGRLNGPSKVN
jgi:hypothetical protein